MMTRPQILAKLATLPSSMYKGKSVSQIRENITYAESISYLKDLCKLYEKEKSRLDAISHKKSD